ncbi:hypothetical protein FS749_007356 [Ceratobasidium sp. UAMH 11750]|nr:hypothetical protein FS749_007356 [Ceratobasidium sp. UAMH 11750]
MNKHFTSLYNIQRFCKCLKRRLARVKQLHRFKPAHEPELPPESKLTPKLELKPPPRNPLLPLDVIDRIADYLFEVHPPSDLNLSLICCTKPLWADIEGFMSASPELHSMGYMRWMTVLTIRVPEDWDRVEQISHRVRELRCLDGTFNSPQRRRILLHFEHLYAVSIDAHSDFTRNDQNQFAYRDIVKAFPPSLRRLEITRAHGPDIRIIATVKECCPNLEELRLGRCTIFNCPSACDFWRSFPFDHDSYMSSQDTDSYAHSLAQELFALRSLTSLRLGLYLIPSTTVLAHRLYHRHNIPAPPVIQWQQEFLFTQLSALAPDAAEPPTIEALISVLHEPDPESEFGPRGTCTRCFEAANGIGRNAEASANAILKGLLPSLEKIQWMNWFSPGHLGFSSYTLPPSG